MPNEILDTGCVSQRRDLKNTIYLFCHIALNESVSVVVRLPASVCFGHRDEEYIEMKQADYLLYMITAKLTNEDVKIDG